MVGDGCSRLVLAAAGCCSLSLLVVGCWAVAVVVVDVVVGVAVVAVAGVCVLLKQTCQESLHDQCDQQLTPEAMDCSGKFF